MLPNLLQKLAGEWMDELRTGGLNLRHPISIMQISGGRNKDRKLIFLVFNHKDNKPVVVLKVARSSDYLQQIRREYQTLCSLWGIEALRSSVPQPMGLFETEGKLVLIERSLPGTSLSTLLKRSGNTRFSQIQNDLHKAREWIELMQTVTQSGESKLLGKKEIEEKLNRLYRASKIILPDKFTKKLLKFADDFHQIQIPLVGCHGDFHPGNILLGPDTIGIIDWEDFTFDAFPFNDLFNFIILYARQNPWTGWKETKKSNSFKYAFLENTRFSRLISTYVQAGFEAVGLPSQFKHFFFSSFLLERATPDSEQGPKRQQQAAQWQERLSWYANYEKDSIFFR